jgi:coniferyl-aldehyde dehydrogenase
MGAYDGRYGFLAFSHQKAVYRQAEKVLLEALLRLPFGEPIRNFLDQAIIGREF